jgi:hypothetical protein
MKTFKNIWIVVLLLSSDWVWAQDPPHTDQDQKQTQWAAYANRGQAKYYNPVEFFKGVSVDFPEMQLINSKNYPQLGAMAKYLESVGVPVMVGNEGELDSFFDLYLPTIARSPYLNGVPLGPNPTAETGKLYLLHHDFAHHFAGIPGIRRSDLANREATKRLIIDIVLWKEIFATAQSSSWMIPKYWEWREKPKPEVLDEFRKYAQGYYTGVSPLTPSEHVDLVQHFVLGETSKYIQLLSKKLTPASLRKTRELGVPRVIPDISPWVGPRIDEKLMAYLIRVAEPVHSYFRPVGHLKFVKYCEDYAEMLMQDWYVQWSEDFEVGVPLQDLHARTLNLIEQMREGSELENPAIGSPNEFKSWEFSLLKSEIMLLGRKFREVIHATPVETDRIALESEYQRVVQFYRNMKQESDFEVAKRGYLELVQHLEREVAVDRYVPWSRRSPDASFTDFWRNPYAVIWKRGDALNNANAAHLSTKKLQHLLDHGGMVHPKRRVEALQKELLDRYVAEQNLRKRSTREAQAVKNQTGSNQQRYREYTQTVKAWVLNSVLPQFPYLRHSDSEIVLAVEIAMRNWLVVFEAISFTESTAEATYGIVDAFVGDLILHLGTTQPNVANQKLKRSALDQRWATLKERVERNAHQLNLSAQRNGSSLGLTAGHKNSNQYQWTRPPIGEGYLPGHIASAIRVDLSSPVAFAPPYRFVSVADWISTKKIRDCNSVLTEWKK